MWRGNIRRRQTSVVYVDYDAYMHSREWCEVRQKRLKKDGYRCALCGTTEHLEVHHLTYERLGRERIDDLITLCKTCHKQAHELKDR